MHPRSAMDSVDGSQTRRAIQVVWTVESAFTFRVAQSVTPPMVRES